MEIFENKIKFNAQRINRLLVQQVGRHINALSQPCHKIDTKDFEMTLFREMGIRPKDVKEFAERTYKDVKVGTTHVVPFTFLIIYLYYRFLKSRQIKMAETALLYLLIKFYGSETRKSYPKFCDEEVFRYTLANITPANLFHREGTIANALIYLMRALNKKYSALIERWDPIILKDFTSQSRRRVAQSVQGFARQYYTNRDKGKRITGEKDVTSEEDDEKKNLYQNTTSGKFPAIEKFLKSMFVYKNFDRRAIDEAKRVSRVKVNLAESMISTIHSRDSEEQIKIILTSFLKEILDAKSLCGQEFFKIVRKLMMVRNYKDSFVFRNLIVNFTQSVFESGNPPTRQLSSRDRTSLEMFVAFYITISFRNLFC
jgi:hypothetical protein